MEKMLSDNALYHVVQFLTLLLSGFIVAGAKHILNEIQSMRKWLKQEHERFDLYMQKERCEIHRQEIERHIKESEARIEKMLSHCKNNGKVD